MLRTTIEQVIAFSEDGRPYTKTKDIITDPRDHVAPDGTPPDPFWLQRFHQAKVKLESLQEPAIRRRALALATEYDAGTLTGYVIERIIQDAIDQETIDLCKRSIIRETGLKPRVFRD